MKRHICVAVVTRNRPQMLCHLFFSLAVMKRPPEEQLSLLVVENNDKRTLAGIIEPFRALMLGIKIEYRNECVPGISAVRNHALNHAIRRGYDLLVYVDDDECVEADWLVNLLAERDRLDLDIVGSPVRLKPFARKLTPMQKLVWRGIAQRKVKSEQRCKAKCECGRGDTIKLGTGSWMGRLDFFRETGLRFDAQFGLTGGEDWHLWEKAKSLGARTGWACNAIVYENVPLSRLTLSYYYRRTRDHNITEFIASYRENPRKTIRNLPLKLAGRAVKFLSTAIAIPFRGAPGIVSSAAALGGLVGLMEGPFGKVALHYLETMGF
ncbi:glycosyltransferase [Brucella sp. IR073]|uniref:glycosyltransferase n=1 Tax=unclassified Brucella TaxID=2632610 RepID=UPI003B983111